MMTMHGIRIANSAEKEIRRKRFAECWDRVFVHVRGIFLLLFFATVFVFNFNHQLEVQTMAACNIHKFNQESQHTGQAPGAGFEP